MEKWKFHQFINRITTEREELREDLMGLPLRTSGCKVRDIGCGWGYITWCLTLEIPNSGCIGIDKFDLDYPPDVEDYFRGEEFSVESVQTLFREVIDIVQSGIFMFQGNDLLNDLRNVIKEKRYPRIRKGDLVLGENLSSQIDLIYCKRVLYNIYLGDNNNPDRDEGVNKAINNIANTLKPNGWFCFVEVEGLRQYSDIENILKQAGFMFDPPRKVSRSYKTILENFNHHPYLIYQCNKI